jgi:hypothetical protein
LLGIWGVLMQPLWEKSMSLWALALFVSSMRVDSFFFYKEGRQFITDAHNLANASTSLDPGRHMWLINPPNIVLIPVTWSIKWNAHLKKGWLKNWCLLSSKRCVKSWPSLTHKQKILIWDWKQILINQEAADPSARIGTKTIQSPHLESHGRIQLFPHAAAGQLHASPVRNNKTWPSG